MAEMMAEYDRRSELKEFDDSKAGEKGFVDAQVVKIPRLFVHKQIESLEKLSPGNYEFKVPVIDFRGLDESTIFRSKIIKDIREACETWGFFQIINHGIPFSVMDHMIDGVRRFHEQETEVKKQLYSRDVTRKFIYYR